MALKDCIKKMEKAGQPVTKLQLKALEQAKKDGLNDADAVRRVALMAHENIIDIVDRARNEGATIAPVANPVTSLLKFQSKALEKVAFRQGEVGTLIDNATDRLTDTMSVGSMLGSSLIDTGGGLQAININDDGQVLAAMQQMLDAENRDFRPDDATARKELGIKGDTAEEMLASVRELEANRQKIIDEIYELALEEKSLEEQVRVIFSGKGEQTFYQQEKPRLVVRHNINEENLLAADGFGGLAIPSLAVMTEGAEFNNYGEMSFIGTADMGDPAQVPIFDADGYTVRFIDPQYKPALERDIAPLLREMVVWGRIYQQGSGTDYAVYYTERHLKNYPDPQAAVEQMEAADSVKAWFLSDVHGVTVDPLMMPVKPAYAWGWDEELIAFFKDDPSLEQYTWESPERYKMLSDATEAVKRAMVRHVAARMGASIYSPKVKSYIEKFYSSGAYFNNNGLIADSMFSKLRDDSKLQGTKMQDSMGTTSALDAVLDENNGERRLEFHDWVQNKVSSVLGEPRIKIGGKWEEYNIENVVRAMKGKLRGTEQGFAESGYMTEGLVRALASHRFKKLEEMRARAEQIRPRDEIVALRDQAQYEVRKFNGNVQGFYTIMRNGYVDYADVGDSVHRAMVDWANQKNLGTADDFAAALERQGFDDVPEWLVDEGMTAAMNMLSVPVPYFEAKPQRVVKLEDFAGVVIPSTTSAQVRAVLLKRGIPFKEYQVSSVRDLVDGGVGIDERQTRMDATNEFTEQLNNQGQRTLFQSEIGFTSGLLTAAKVMPFTRTMKDGVEVGTDSKQIMATLMKQPNVKKQELEWLGVEEWAELKGKITRDELIDYIEKGGVQLVETAWGGASVIDPNVFLEVNENLTLDFAQAGMLQDEDGQFDGDLPTIVYDYTDEITDTSYTVYIDIEAGNVTVTPDDGETWLEVYGRQNSQNSSDAVHAISRHSRKLQQDNIGYSSRALYEGQYQLPGGTNYREVMLHLPDPNWGKPTAGELVQNLVARFNELPVTKQAEINEYYARRGSPYNREDDNQFKTALRHNRVMPADLIELDLEDDVMFTLLNDLFDYRANLTGVYTSHTFQEVKNIIVWMRVKDRIGPNGEKILFLEEVQSDWHQEGRELGYENTAEFAKAEAAALKAINLLKKVESKAFRSMQHLTDLGVEDAIADMTATTLEMAGSLPDNAIYLKGERLKRILQNRDDWKEYISRAATGVETGYLEKHLTDSEISALEDYHRIYLEANQAKATRDSMRGGGIPNAPFKDNAWAALAMKRAIRMAAEGGYDQIAWTTGDSQADRYDLGQVVSEIDFYKKDNGVTQIDFVGQWDGVEETVEVDKDGIILSGSSGTSEWIGKHLNQVIGGMAADRILNADVNGSLSTEEELRVGGDGMRSFYDKVLPNITSKVARKLDKKAKVNRFGGKLDVPPNYMWKIVETTAGPYSLNFTGHYETRGAAENAIQIGGESGRTFDLVAPANPDETIGTPIHTMNITADMMASAMEGQTLFQNKERGSITFRGKEGAIIRLSKSRDLSTFLHESGHLYLEMMGDLVEMPGVDKSLIDDYTKILTFLGVTNRREIGVDQHELFSRSFEAYLREGIAPTAEMQSLFTTYKGWLITVYKNIKDLLGVGEELTDEMRGVFDRLLASDEAISQAEDMMQYVQLYQTANDMGVSQEVFDVYKAAMQQQHDEAVDKESKKMIKALYWSQKVWWRDELKKIEAEVRAEAEKDPINIALALLQRGKLPNGEKAQSPFKLSKDDLIARFGKTFLKRLPRPYVYSAKGGVDLDIAASIFGFKDGETLMQAIIDAPKMETWIKDESRRIMENRHPDPLNDPSIGADAIEAVHNTKRRQILAAELKALRAQQIADAKIVKATKDTAKREDREAREANKGQVPKRENMASIKAAAAAAIAKLRIRDVNPTTYLQAEKKSARLAFEALERKDYGAAYKHKRAQIMNFEAYRAAVKAQAQAARDQKYLKKFVKTSRRNRLRERMGRVFQIDAIDAILDGINFTQRSNKQLDQDPLRAELLPAIRAQVEDGTLLISEDVLRTLETPEGKNWREMTFEELSGIRDVIKQLHHQATTDYKALINGEQIIIQEAKDAVANSIIENNKVVPIPRGGETAGQAGKRSVREGVGHWLRSGSIARVLDKSGFGAVTRNIIVPIRRAYVEKLIPAQDAASKRIAAIYQEHYSKAELAQLHKYLPQETMGEKMSKADILAIALNWGSESNRAALLDGVMVDEMGNESPAYTQQGVEEALSNMDARDWAFVQDMWDFQSSYWEQIAETEMRRRGVAPQKVEALPFEIRTSDGNTITVKGGYHRLQYDSRHPQKGATQAKKAAGGPATQVVDDVKEHYELREQEFQNYYTKMVNGTYISASTRAGSTYDRKQNHGRVVRLSLTTIDMNVREVIRDLSLGDEVNFVNRILNSNEVNRAAANTQNSEVLKELRLWLSDAAVGELPAQSVIEKGLSWTRVGFTKSKLAFNVYVTALQLTGIFQSMAVIGSKNWAKGFGKFIANPSANYKMVIGGKGVAGKSKFMEARYGVLQTWDKDVSDTAAFLNATFGPAPTMAKQSMEFIGHYYFYPIAKMQSLVDVTTWMGAYEAALNDPSITSEEDAIFAADAQVENSQTSGLFSDRSGIERGTLGGRTRQGQFVRLWTTLISYMLAKGNIAYEKGAGTDFKNMKQVVQFATDMVLLFMIEGIASSLLYGRWPGDDDEDETWVGWTAGVTMDSMLSGIPLVREYSSAKYGSGNTPVGAIVKDGFEFVRQSKQGEADKAWVKAGIKVGGTMLHLPASQPNRFVDAYFDDDPEWYEYILGVKDK